MISPLSSVGKTMLSSLEGAIGRGMPIDQAITYVKSMAQQGVAPLVDLYALLKQFERMKQQPVQAPMGGNLKQQLDNLESSVVRSPGGITGRAAPAMSEQGMAPDMGGIASLDAGRMENPGFYGGGVVALVEGGDPKDTKPKPITPELYTLPSSLEELARQKMAKEAALRTPEGRAAFEAELDAEMKARGLGKYAPSLGMREQYAERKTKEAEALPAEEAALNEEAYWEAVAATDQPDLISAMAKAKAGVTARKRTSKEKILAAKDKAEDLRILRQEAKEALARGDYDKYKEKLSAAETLSQTSVKEYVTEKEADEDARLAAERARQLAREQKGEADNILRQLGRTPETLANGQPNPEYQRLSRIYTLAKGTGRGTSARDYQTVKAQWGQANKTLKTAQENYNLDDSPENAEALQKAQELADYWNRQLLEYGGVEGMPSEFGGSTELPADYVLDQQ
jgi:hypothetical protein